MNTYETTATVEDHGEVHLAGVPFGPGTEVAVTISVRSSVVSVTAPAISNERRIPMKDLFAQVKARNTETVGPLRREELYDRKVLR